MFNFYFLVNIIYMNNKFLITHPEVFHLDKFLNNQNNYFEGWYFKCISDSMSISFIPGISICNGKKSAFIQIITNNNSYYIPYSFESFSYSFNPFFIKISNNYFSLDKVKLDISYQDLSIKGTLEFSNLLKLERKFLCPNIMGPFSYIPFMECNHAILSMKHNIYGNLDVNNNLINFNNGIGYLEKDYGISFPSSYIWCQGNCFKNSNTSVFLSIANIPFKSFHFLGFICVVNINGKEYRFTTYNGSKIEKFLVKNNSASIILKRNSFRLNLYANMNNFFNLKSPKFGEMKNTIFESIDSTISLSLNKNSTNIFYDISTNCGLEIVK